jgi:hypothetical protein
MNRAKATLATRVPRHVSPRRPFELPAQILKRRRFAELQGEKARNKPNRARRANRSPTPGAPAPHVTSLPWLRWYPRLSLLPPPRRPRPPPLITTAATKEQSFPANNSEPGMRSAAAPSLACEHGARSSCCFFPFSRFLPVLHLFQIGSVILTISTGLRRRQIITPRNRAISSALEAIAAGGVSRR